MALSEMNVEMGTTLNRRAYERMIQEDLTWLMQQPRSLERDHIEAIINASADHEYGLKAKVECNDIECHDMTPHDEHS